MAIPIVASEKGSPTMLPSENLLPPAWRPLLLYSILRREDDRFDMEMLAVQGGAGACVRCERACVCAGAGGVSRVEGQAARGIRDGKNGLVARGDVSRVEYSGWKRCQTCQTCGRWDDVTLEAPEDRWRVAGRWDGRTQPLENVRGCAEDRRKCRWTSMRVCEGGVYSVGGCKAERDSDTTSAGKFDLKLRERLPGIDWPHAYMYMPCPSQQAPPSHHASNCRNLRETLPSPHLRNMF